MAVAVVYWWWLLLFIDKIAVIVTVLLGFKHLRLFSGKFIMVMAIYVDPQ